MTDDCYKLAKEMVIAKKDKLEALSKELLAKEALDLPEIERILGPKTRLDESISAYMSVKNLKKPESESADSK